MESNRCAARIHALQHDEDGGGRLARSLQAAPPGTHRPAGNTHTWHTGNPHTWHTGNPHTPGTQVTHTPGTQVTHTHLTHIYYLY